MLRYTGSYTYLTKIYDIIYIYLVLATYAIWGLRWTHIDSTSPWLQGQDTGILFGPCDPAVPSTGNKNVNFKLYGKVNKGCFKMKKKVLSYSLQYWHTALALTAIPTLLTNVPMTSVLSPSVQWLRVDFLPFKSELLQTYNIKTFPIKPSRVYFHL